MANKAKGPRGATIGVNIGLSDKSRATVIDSLSVLLADEVLLYIKTRNFHWNVVSPSFSEMHKFFEEQYEALDEVFDAVAERIRALAGRAPGSMIEFLKLTRLSETTGKVTHAAEMVRALLDDHEKVIRHIRADIEHVGAAHDVGTEDFLTGLLEEHEKMAWMLRSYAQ